MGVLPIYMGVKGEENAGLTVSFLYFAMNKNASEKDQKATKQFLDYILSEQLITFRLGFVRIRERGITLQRNAFQRHIAFHIVTHAIRVRDKLIIANLTLTLFLGNPIPILT